MASIYDLKPAFQGVLRPLARALAGAGVTANHVTVAAAVLSIGVGALMALWPTSRWPLLLLGPWLFARMALNAIDGMMARKFGRVVNITSSAVKAPIDILGLSNGARAGLTGFIAGIARKTVKHNVTINNLLPGAFDTDRMRSNMAANAKKQGITEIEMAKKRAESIPAGRFGDPYEFGELCAYVCSAQAGYITGQNLLIDGGNFPGTL